MGRTVPAPRQARPTRAHSPAPLVTSLVGVVVAHVLAQLCEAAGLVVTAAYDGWEDRPLKRTSPELLLLARKR